MKEQKDKKAVYVAPFFAVLTILTIVAFIIPLRPTRSYSEKRSLAEFPEFSMEALASGSYLDDISTWFSDTFPGRESWIEGSIMMQSLYGYSDVTINGQMQNSVEIPTFSDPTEPPATEPVLTEPPTEPAAQPSETEQQATRPPVELVEMPDVPVEEWGGVDAGETNAIITGTVIQIGDTAFNTFSFSQRASDMYAKTLSELANILEPKGVRVICAMPPQAVGIMVEQKYMEQLNCADQEAALDYVLSQMNDKVVKVDMFQRLVEHNDEYLYFRTDHHWTALGAYYAYQEICAMTGMEAAPLENFEVWDQGDFIGTLYSKCAKRNKLRIDTCYAYNPPGNLTTYITDDKYGTFETEVLTDMSNAGTHAKYYVFIYGDNALTEITNHDIPDGKSCVVIKDSFGNPLVPFLTQNYHKVYALDFRHYKEMNLQEFAQAYNIDDVIFANMLGMSQSTKVNGTFARLSGLES